MFKFNFFLFCLCLFFLPKLVLALEPGTLLYRSSSNGKIFGLNTDYLIETSWGLVNKINSGHVAIYVGQEQGIDYVVEALAEGIVKKPANQFINEAEGEIFLGAKIPKEASFWQKARAVTIAKSLADRGMSYDFSFKEQKGPLSGQWTCVGLVEKIYESANALQPERLSALEYNPNNYAIDITPDGFDNSSVYNNRGDVFSTEFEFSKINRYQNTILPAPELIGFNAGKELNGQRYIFLPYTQFLQETLESVPVNINLSSYFNSSDLRGKTPVFNIIVRWSLINNPISTVKQTTNNIANFFTNLFSGPDRDQAVLLADLEDDYYSNTSFNFDFSNFEYDLNLDYEPTSFVLNNEKENEINIEDNNKPKLLISLIYSQSTNDFLEIFNYGQTPIDLVEENIRIEKAVSAVKPSIVLRFDSDHDATYPGGRIIAPNSSYLIVREQADSFLLEQADAIGFRSNFTWTNSGYTLYLATGPVRSDDDEERIIDKVGWGEATYYAGTPALAIEDNFALRRKPLANSRLEDIVLGGAHASLAPIYNSYNNGFDFLLWPLSNQLKTDLVETEIETIQSSEEELVITEEIITDNPLENEDSVIEKEIVKEEEKVADKIEDNKNDLTLLITEVSAQGTNDYLKIYNYGEEDIDLAKANIRISKAYQSHNFSIVLRFDNDNDGIFPGGKIIKANTSYLIARDKADSNIIEISDAIGTRSGFTWTGNGYTLYLSTGPVSSDDDERIIDKVGWGEALFYNISPALEIKDNLILKRKALVSSRAIDLKEGGAHYLLAPVYNSGNNAFDFLLIPNTLIIKEEIIEEEEVEVIEEEEIEEEIIEEKEETEEEVIEEELEKKELTLLISKISADGFNDYLEIYNYGDKDIDLAKESIRISKAYQSENFTIVLRFDNNDDGNFPGGKIIKANSSYLIARDRADSNIIENSDAIGIRPSFTWTGNGYTLYLSAGPVSSDDDERIIDKVGWGEALFYQTAPAFEIELNYILQRKALANSKIDDMKEGGAHYLLAPVYNSGNNAFDFLLIPNTLIIEEEEEEIIEEEEEEEEIIEEEEEEITLLISKISAEGFNDYLEIYNYGEEDIDLAEANIRISKAYQSHNFSIVLRFDNDDDGVFPGGKIIEANSSYLIVRDKAEEKILNKAEAIGTRSSFTWTGNGYTLYLSTGPVSSDDDERIIDKVGWGEALFFKGAPASAILNSYALRRKPLADSKLSDIVFGGLQANLPPIYNSNNNAFDFILWPKNNILPVNYLSTLYLDYSPPAFIPYLDDFSLAVDDLAYLWHFDECYGDVSLDELSRFQSNPVGIFGAAPFMVDKYGCARRLSADDDNLVVNFPSPIDANNFALSLLVRSEYSNGRFRLRLSGDDPNRNLDIRFYSNMTEFFNGFPGLSGRYDISTWKVNKDWQRLIISFNNLGQDSAYWFLDFNGHEKFSHLFSGILSDFNKLEILATNNHILIDELAIWDRGLSQAERVSLVEPLPFLPHYPYEPQIAPKLKYAWLFDQAEGEIAEPAVGDQGIEIEGDSLVLNGYRGNALQVKSTHEAFELNLNNPLTPEDLSISFWWKSIDAYHSSSMRLGLADEEKDLFSLVLTGNSASYLFNQSSGALASLPNDHKWHHVALSYDSYLQELSFYLNGEQLFNRKIKKWWPNTNNLSRLRIVGQSGFTHIDELKLWQGTLQAEQVMHEYSLIME